MKAPIAASMLVALTTFACTTPFSKEDAGNDGVTDTGPDTTPPPCDRRDFHVAQDNAVGVIADRVYYIADSQIEPPYDTLRIELYYDGGDPPPLEGPGTYELAASEAERNYATCGTCVLIAAGCTGPTETCETVFFHTGGILELESNVAIGEPLRGSLRDVVLIEVTIESGTSESVPVPDGQAWCIDELHFDVPLDPMP
jgi:hypothetical protein